MPGRLPAPAHLLDAIFAHTNKLCPEDRQIILKFLAGEDSIPPGLMTSISLGNAHQAPATVTNSNSIRSTPAMIHPVQRALQAMNPIVSNTNTNQNTSSNSLNNNSNSSSGSGGNGASSNSNNNTFVRQILLHEEKRVEFRQIGNNTLTGNNNNNPADQELANVPTYILSSNSYPNGMKQYTIIDQIIFEMDYSNGCWRKLRRRVRIADKNLEDFENSGSNSGNQNHRYFDSNGNSTVGNGNGNGGNRQSQPPVRIRTSNRDATVPTTATPATNTRMSIDFPTNNSSNIIGNSNNNSGTIIR